ncbi:V-type proton ATPase 116 kDa subunit a1 isoform X2 [Nilaparvata lugens]|uniref:V-type proton ATPase 116 kDa subunit a1 isoform X2 n=1 Tax=Nilaparvata lugens TaxID=108931 RepID=UPI000B98B6AE|nr:V-type proton ATPase 116 kDa subunit a1 isoform X2 [Nilaparvata lugens]XP_039290194.1 V-type proton ATPase 116 kDa subunit a1 isoform X2 [Nilaparvata lugens]
MGALFRSEEMALCQLFIQPEAAYSVVASLGEAGVVQFRDLNAGVNAFQRKFVSEVRRCDEMERKLRYIEAEVLKDKVNIPESNEYPFAPNPREIIDLEAHLERTESEILESSHNAVNLKFNFLELTELKHLLQKTHSFFQEQEGAATGSDSQALISDDGQTPASRGRLGFVAGVVPRERVPAFERMLWRISRGNVFLRQAELEVPLEDPNTGNEIFKTVFVAFFQGEQLKSRVKKVCSGFHASFYPCPSSHEERLETVKGVKTRLEDLNLVLNQTQEHRKRVLTAVAKELHNWTVMVRKMKAIYHTMNLFNMDVTKKCLIAECWVPVKDLNFIRKVLADGAKEMGSSIPSFLNVIETPELPPTFNRTNKFTAGFQHLIDAYGVATYREVNPALYTIITFPFLFGIMFGDAGHGLILFIFGAYMVLYEKSLMRKKSNNEIWNIFFGGRYIILLMGVFSFYTGIIYNDVFSKSLNVFKSQWSVTGYNHSTVMTNHYLQLNPSTEQYSGLPYTIGLDPVWQLAEANKIIFMNSFKMKLSIIFGVVHMIFGVSLSVVNHLHFKQPMNIILEFIPQMIFLVLLFLYMVALMFTKWIMYGPTNAFIKGPGCAPSVLITFINMMLFKENTKVEHCGDGYMFENQKYLQLSFMIISLICIPVLLLGKPVYLIFFHKKSPPKSHSASNGDLNQGIELQPDTQLNGASNGDGVIVTSEGAEGGEEEEEPAVELFIHQAIHTIEYVLSTISHTASYLRLWALSLAHAQLSEVLWNMVLRKGLKFHSNWGAIALTATFCAWAIFTLAILVMMEGLSAFLHTLRLHWVEFMSKFYTGTGYAFAPFSFKRILETEEASEE